MISHKVNPVLGEFYSGKNSNNSISASMMIHNINDHSIKSISIHGAHVAPKLRIAAQGIPGAYGEAAAMKAYPNCEAVQCEQFKDAIQAVESGWAEEAVIPIENSIGGSVVSNYDLLLSHSLHVVGETHLFVDHCLLALPGVSKHHLTSVFSHPQALIQCKMSLNMLGVATCPTDNTAVAAQIVASRGVRENGAIASARAAQLYGLHVIAHKFQDRSNNSTRFLKLARNPVIPTTYTRSKIESRPLEKHSTSIHGFGKGSNTYFKNVYCIDFEAPVMEPRVQYALERLQELASYVRILGRYPMDAAAC